MGFSVHWSWLAALSCLLCMGDEVRCDCTEANLQIEGGDYKLTKQLNTGSMLIYNCPEDYYPYPALTRLCQPNGSWRPAPEGFNHQRCKLVECPDPNVLEYGDVNPPQEQYFVGNETTYECYSGYTMRGSSRRVCLPNGKWSGNTPICSRDSGDHCADPGIPAGASRTGNMFGIDDTVKYSCNGNLFLVGSSERVCKEDGHWTGKEPACYYKHTYDTSLEVSEAFGSAITESLTNLESTDDTQAGRKIRIPKSGTLNMYIALDISESIEPKQVDEAKRAVLTLITKISSFSVNPNYEIIFFSSEIFEMANIVDFMHGRMNISTAVNEVKNFKVSEGNSGTDLNSVFKRFLEQMAVIKQRVGEATFKEHRHVLILFTDGAYNMGGSPEPTVKRIKNMVYMNHTGEAQSRDEYLDIYIFGIGKDLRDEVLQPLTAGTGGQHYFRMKDIKKLQETFDEIIDEEEVKGRCGLYKNYTEPDKTDREIKRKQYPWIAFIFIRTPEGSKKCLGSLVNPQFVLTAAHCVPFGVVPEDITVEINDGDGKQKKVKDFKIHENYNVSAKVDKKVKEFYDYDVALIQLEKDVKISTACRPICIPCTEETSAALKLGSGSTCKQQEQLLLKNQHERLSFLTKTDNIVDEKDVIAKLGDSRNGCIEHALHAPGITTSEATDAVTDNFLCTGGLQPHRDHIACTGDSGGAVFKNFEHRTVQVALVSWGTTAKCTSGGLVESDENSRDFHINLFKVVPFLKSILGKEDQDEFTPINFLND